MNQVLPIHPEMLALVRRHHPIRRLSLFGSQLKGTSGADSNIDLLVDFEAGANPTWLDMARIEEELPGLMGVRR